MSYVNGTTHYNLPQTVGTDKRDWTDTNQAFADIDSAIHTAVETAETGATNIQALQTDVNALTTRVTSAEADISTNTTDIGVINTNINTINADIADVRQDAEDMICAYNEATATSSRAYAIDDYFIYNDVLYKVTAPIAIGGTIVPNTNCSATNATTEIAQLNSDLTNGKTVATIIADGVKSYKTLFNELYSLIPSNIDILNSYLKIGPMKLFSNSDNRNESSAIGYSTIFETADHASIITCVLSSTLALCKRYYGTLGIGSPANYSIADDVDRVPTNGTIISIVV